MKMIRTLCTAVAMLSLSQLATVRAATLDGDALSVTTSANGATTILPLGGPFGLTPPADFGFCIGPNADNCVTSGMSGNVHIEGTALTMTFFGGTFGAAGDFHILVSGVDTPITSASGGGALFDGQVSVNYVSPSSFEIVGSTAGTYNAVGGITLTGSVNLVPEPSTCVLAVMGVAFGAFAAIRRRAKQ